MVRPGGLWAASGETRRPIRGQGVPVRAPLGDCWPFAARGRISLSSVPATMTAALSNAKAGKRSRLGKSQIRLNAETSPRWPVGDDCDQYCQRVMRPRDQGSDMVFALDSVLVAAVTVVRGSAAGGRRWELERSFQAFAVCRRTTSLMKFVSILTSTTLQRCLGRSVMNVSNSRVIATSVTLSFPPF